MTIVTIIGAVILAGVCLVVGGLWLFGSSFSYSSPDSYSQPEEVLTHTIWYKIEGTAPSIDVTYENASGGTEQMSNMALPWIKVFAYDDQWAFEDGDFVYLSAQNNRDKGDLTCQIYVDGELFKESSSSGAYAIVSCSGSIGRD